MKNTSKLIIFLVFLMMISMPQLWAEEKKEVVSISGPLIVILLILLQYAGFSPFQRVSLILNDPNPPIFSFYECLTIIPISIYLFYSSCKNMQYAVMFPIKFLDNYRDRIKPQQIGGLSNFTKKIIEQQNS